MLADRFRGALAGLTLGVYSLAGACDADGPKPWSLASGRIEAAFESNPLEVRFLDKGERLLAAVTAGGLRFGKVASWDPDFNYDPYNMVAETTTPPHEPPDFAWVAAERVLSWDAESGHARIALSDGGRADLWVEAPAPDILCLRLHADGAGTEEIGEPDYVYVSVDLAVSESEQFYGLGEVFGSLAHRGQVVAMQMELADTESQNNEAHIRIPFLVSTESWAVFFDTMRPGYVDVAASDPGRVRFVFAEPDLRFCMAAGDEPLDLVAAYHLLTAPPALPPIWAFAPIQWRNEVSGQDMVLQDATDIRTNRVPTGAIWLDRPYQSGYNTMDMDPEKFPDATGMVETLHALGFKLAGWNSPYLNEEDPDHPMAQEQGFFVRYGPSTPAFRRFGDLLDLTNPDAMAFWQDRVRSAMARGFEGFKLDYGEDIVIGLGDARFHYDFFNGEDERTMHAHYATFYHRAYAEPLGPQPFILARAATIGGQAHASVIWPGDLCSDFRDWQDTDEFGVVHVGGLPVAARAGLGLSVSGFPFFASDTGGFRHGRPTSEVLVRWAQFSALFPIMQYGGGGANHNPWDFTRYDDSRYDETTLETFRRYAVLHIRLFPYFYSLALEAVSYGRPVVRPLGLVFRVVGHPDDTFLVGESLLVAPLLHGGTQRTVVIPPGEWVDWWTGEVHEGPGEMIVEAPLDTLPLYVRRPGIVPMLRPTVQTLTRATAPGIDSLWSRVPRLWGRLVPAPNTSVSFALHDTATLAMDGGTEETTITFRRGTMYAGILLEVFQPNPALVTMDGSPLPEAASREALEKCDACWMKNGVWVWVSVSDRNEARDTIQVVLQPKKRLPEVFH